VPSCYNPCVVVNEGPPTQPPQTIQITRNCYVPIKVVTQEGPSNITPVNINVNWREVHFLCNQDGTPMAPSKAAEVLQKLQTLYAGAPDQQPKAPEAGAPAPSQASAPPPPPVDPRLNAPLKRWVWLEKQGVYGFGYQRADGFWVIDPSSKRPELPPDAVQPSAESAGVNHDSTTRS
jgi:hypothetical protein